MIDHQKNWLGSWVSIMGWRGMFLKITTMLCLMLTLKIMGVWNRRFNSSNSNRIHNKTHFSMVFQTIKIKLCNLKTHNFLKLRTNKVKVTRNQPKWTIRAVLIWSSTLEPKIILIIKKVMSSSHLKEKQFKKINCKMQD
jgi:hypothetical protein